VSGSGSAQEGQKIAKTRQVPLIIEDCALMTTGVEYGCSLFGLKPGFDPVKAQDLIEDFLKRYRAGQVEGPLAENAAAYLGIFWGMTLVLAYDWSWVAVSHGEWRGFGVADAKRRYLALPVQFFHQLMHDEAGQELPGPAVRFKTIGANNLPRSKPGAFTVITN
jgi:hypothetical protein